MTLRLLILSSLILLLSGCTSTEINSYTDPEYTSFKSRKVVVSAPNSDLELGAKLEKYISRELIKRNVKATSLGEIVSTYKQANSEYIKVNLKTTEADSLLLILLNSGNFDKSIISTYTTANSTIYPNYNYINKHPSAYSASAHATDNKTQINLKLYEIKTGKVIWTSDAVTNTKERHATDEEAALSELAKTFARELTKSEHIGEKLSKNDDDD